MFLATTALTEFWDPDEELVMLGTGCLRYDQRAAWQRLRYRVMPEPWDDRERFYEAIRYLDTVYERLLRRLAEYLNATHGVSYTVRYWRILIGPWLVRYLHVVYDRSIRLAETFRRHPDSRTTVLDQRAFRTPLDTLHAARLFSRDEYNLQVCSQILKEQGYVFPTRMYHGQGDASDECAAPTGREPLIDLAKQGVRLITGTFLRLRNDGGQVVALCEAFASWRNGWALAWRSSFHVLPVDLKPSWSFAIPPAVFDRRRTGLAGLSAQDEFERLSIQLLPQNLPRLFLEGYAVGRAESLRRLPKIPQVLVSATGWHVHEPFKFFSAEATQRGSKLVAVQHGGGYGFVRFYPEEWHERRLSDVFLVWGWADEQSNGCQNLPSPKLSPLTTRPRRSNGKAPLGNTILFVMTAHPRYLYKFNSAPVGSQWEGYFAWQAAFLGALPSQLRQALLLRPYLDDYGEGSVARLTDRFGEVRRDTTRPFLRLLRRARVVVIDHCGTTFMEAFLTNAPTVLFWDPHRWELRPAAEPWFDRLRRAGIWWDSPEGAARQVAQIYQEPSAWWESRVVQEARRSMLERYALARRDWQARWVRALADVAGA